jgi:hypothetical protein
MDNMNKKGEYMVNVVVGVVVAVLCLIILGYVFWLLALSGGGELQQARASLKELSASMKLAKEQGNSDSVLITSPRDWWVIAWPYQDNLEKPVQCKSDYCICICDIPTKVSQENSLASCNAGACEDYSESVKTIYMDEQDEWYVNAIINFAEFFGKDTTNVPIDIRKPVLLRVEYTLTEGYKIIKNEQ